MLDYLLFIEKMSLFNTGQLFPIYVSLLTLRWLKKQGGVEVMVIRNKEKADLLYGEIDRNSAFYGPAAEEDRSRMNVCFLLHEPSRWEDFLKACAASGIVGVNGHRFVGGFWVSLYNVMGI